MNVPNPAPKGRRRAVAPRVAATGLALLAGSCTQKDAVVQDDPTVEGDVLMTVSAAKEGAANPRLAGVSWNTGPDLDLLAPYRPPIVRIDAFLGALSPEPGVLDVQPVLDKVAAVREAGGEPLVLLAYMPEWLLPEGAEPCLFCDAIRMAPADLDAWEQLVGDVVWALATAPEPATRFEVWNEPDLIIFWQDTDAAFVETALRTHRAVESVEAEIGVDLQVGGPTVSSPYASEMSATLLPAPVSSQPSELTAAYLRGVRDAGLSIDFVAWHWYANLPCFGPDGRESFVPEEIWRALACRNPDLHPRIYGEQTALMRDLVETELGPGYDPLLIIDEWNISGGGYDLRHDSNEGAAFAAASLIEMERAGLDEAAYFRAVGDGATAPGDWGLVGLDGTRDPAWSIMHEWSSRAGELRAVEGDDPAGGLWGRAVESGGDITLLLVTYTEAGSSARSVTVQLAETCNATASVAVIDAEHAAFDSPVEHRVENGRLTLALPDQSVTRIVMPCASR